MDKDSKKFGQKGFIAQKQCQGCKEMVAVACRTCPACSQPCVKKRKVVENRSCNLTRSKRKMEDISNNMNQHLGYDVAVVYVRRTPTNRQYIDIAATEGPMRQFLFQQDGGLAAQGHALVKFFKSMPRGNRHGGLNPQPIEEAHEAVQENENRDTSSDKENEGPSTSNDSRYNQEQENGGPDNEEENRGSKLFLNPTRPIYAAINYIFFSMF
ncbi:uncharacterized protein LOC130623409 isoform X2 [Hydractinia symbiolongicarpus]|uniref:uncharacterized protein LOC130623409 isoform X2 n=1 Tax=Hydractinia symbiolongicarpus TaxID=13093 RepID=UPI00254D783A|nr:uncharacterized protein LOC130623409 isoform X2 [Hydractinia symbiolongicarpus]